jgi:hypothetical protein
VVFECFHNFVALSQWGNSIFGIMSRLSQDWRWSPVRAAFEKAMSGNPDAANGAPYTPLEMFVMELFRTISPNGGSISSISDTRQASSSGDSVSPFVRFGLPYERSGYIISPHKRRPRTARCEGLLSWGDIGGRLDARAPRSGSAHAPAAGGANSADAIVIGQLH